MSAVAVLTYHRIIDEGRREFFYDVTVSAFENQLRMIAERLASQLDGMLKLRDDRYVVLTFDDGTADHRRVAQMLTLYGLTGIFFVITGRLGEAGYLSESDVRWIARHGHRIGSHTVTHRHLPKLESRALTEELTASKAALEVLTEGPIQWMALPGGIYSEGSIAAATAAGYAVIRTMDWGYATLPLRGVVPSLPVLPSYDARRFEHLLSGRAPLWIYSAKRSAKRLLGEAFYNRIRNSTARLLDP